MSTHYSREGHGVSRAKSRFRFLTDSSGIGYLVWTLERWSSVDREGGGDRPMRQSGASAARAQPRGGQSGSPAWALYLPSLPSRQWLGRAHPPSHPSSTSPRHVAAAPRPAQQQGPFSIMCFGYVPGCAPGRGPTFCFFGI